MGFVTVDAFGFDNVVNEVELVVDVVFVFFDVIGGVRRAVGLFKNDFVVN